MTPEEKAKELVDKFYEKVIGYGDAKECALIVSDEILNAVTTIADKKYEYWQYVKQEIEKL